jgi:hypothetical protein
MPATTCGTLTAHWNASSKLKRSSRSRFSRPRKSHASQHHLTSVRFVCKSSGMLEPTIRTTNGCQSACLPSVNHGQLAPGMAGDIVTLDYGAITRDAIDGMIDESEFVLARGTAHHVSSLFVAGRQVVEDGQVLGVDMAAIEKELTGQTRAQKGERAYRSDQGSEGQPPRAMPHRRSLSGRAALVLFIRRHTCGCRSDTAAGSG